jgi:glycosyltransferase involved in cell wall biosynthesis
MKISVITVCFNAAATIGDALRSVAAQDWPAVEHIIVDGASTDETLKIVAQNQHDSMRVASEPDKGLYDAMNKGVSLSSGDLIGFLNADDFFCRADALSLIARRASEQPCDAVSGAVAIVKPDDVFHVTRAYSATSFRPRMLRFGHALPHPGFYARRSVFERIGAFNLEFRLAADFEWMVRFFLVHGLRAATLPNTIVGMREGGLTTAGFGANVRSNKEMDRALRRNGFSSHELLIWAKYSLKTLQWLAPANEYPPPDPASLLSLFGSSDPVTAGACPQLGDSQEV